MIVTFYSYKGGVGRSMALANVADLLSRSGLRVLIVDFDLEAPGLEHFFPIDHDQVQGHKGLLDLLLTFKYSMSTASSGNEERNAFRQLDDFLTTVYPSRHGAGGIDLLPAGRRLTDEQIGRYGEELRRFDWLDFYFSWAGELLFEWLRQTFLKRYDAILVDSRTGVTEMGGICAYQLADVIVVLCAPNLQNLEGTQAMVRHFLSPQVRAVRHDRPVEVLIVPARVDQEDTNLRRIFEQRFEERFDSYVPTALADQGLRFWDMQIPYEPRYAFDEQVVTDPNRAEERRGLAASYAKLLQGITLVAPEQSALATLRPTPGRDGEGRLQGPVETRYDPTSRFATADVFVSFGHGSEDYARQIRELLLREALTVATSPDPRAQEAPFTRAASDLVQAARIGLVLVGPEDDQSKWRQREIDQLLTPRGQRSIYTVLLPGASRDQVPSSLVNFPVVDISSGSAGLDSLLAAVRMSSVQLGSASSPSSKVERNPYPGMAPFRELDQDVYFGREAEVNDMLGRLGADGACSVVGPAGIGKTSAVFAGLVPALRRGRLPASERWPVVSVRPGDRALSVLVEALTKLKPATTFAAEEVEALVASLRQDFQRVVLVIDQFEDLFTRTRESEQAQFIGYLNELCNRDRGLVMPVVILRSDFLGELARAPDLAQLLAASSPVLIGPLSEDKLREAIEIPARRFGVTLEPGLADRLLADVADEPGALTLLQSVLHKLWLNQKDGYLTHAAYEQAGGAAHALANGADATLDALSPDGREIAQRIWLRLVESDKGGVRSREPVEISELISGLERQGAGPDQVRAVVEQFINQRLLATNETPGQPLRVAMTSEALIDTWPTLQRWIADSREALRARSRLDAAVREWVALSRDVTTLLPRERVEQLLSAMGDTPLSMLEREYVAATQQYPPVPPKIAALLSGLTALTGAVIGLMTSFSVVHWTSAQTTLVAIEVAAFWALAGAVTAHLWPQTKEQPVAVAGTVTAFVSATLALGWGFAWWQLTQPQNASLISLVTAIVAVASALAAQSTVTAGTTPTWNAEFQRSLDRPYGSLPVPPKIAALLTGLTALTGAVIGLMTGFSVVHWTSAQTTLVAIEVAAFWVLAGAVTAHLWPQTKRQPVAVAGTLTAFVSATLAVSIGFAWWQLTQSQNASFISLVTAIVAVASALTARSTVTASMTAAGWSGGISPPGSHRTESLPSLRSSHLEAVPEVGQPGPVSK